ncbi:MAG: class I SAM-dependent methyltransferase [Vicinamibacterales bacterium]
MTAESEDVRLRAFWNDRYATFALSESGWLGAGEDLNRRIYSCKRQAVREALGALGLTPDRPWSVLDAGCGQGHFARFYASEYPACTYVGLDIAERAIHHLQRAMPGAEFHGVNFCTWDDPQHRQFDLIQSIDVLHLILDDDAVTGALANLAGRLAPDGALLLATPLPSQTVAISDYLRYRDRRFWETELASLGLRIVNERPMYYWLPDGGPENKYVRYALNTLGAGALHILDRVALAVRLPQSASAGIDSRTRLLTVQRA